MRITVVAGVSLALLAVSWIGLGSRVVGQKLVLAREGMSQAMVRLAMSSPDERITSRRMIHELGQGELEPKIEEVWTYSPPGWRSAGVEVYFDGDGRVIGVNQGQG